MLTIKNIVPPSPDQMMNMIRGMRNPKNSWDKSDSCIEYIEDPVTLNKAPWQFHLGEADHKLMMTLENGGPVHAKYRRFMHISFDITAPLYWWKEFDTYRIGVAPHPDDIEMNSCSTMHKIHEKEFTLDDFAHEHLFGNDGFDFVDMSDIMDYTDPNGYKGKLDSLTHLEDTIDMLNFYRKKYLDIFKVISCTERNVEKLKKLEKKRKRYWWQLIQLLPSSYLQTRTVDCTYEALAGMYFWRQGHKQDEWREQFCPTIEQFPWSDCITDKRAIPLKPQDTREV